MTKAQELELVKRVIAKFQNQSDEDKRIYSPLNSVFKTELAVLNIPYEGEVRELYVKLHGALAKATLALKHESESFKRKALSEYVIDYMFYKPEIEADDDDDDDEYFYKDDE